MEIWKTLRVSHIPTPPAATTDKCRTRRYTNNPLGTKDRSGHWLVWQNLQRERNGALFGVHGAVRSKSVWQRRHCQRRDLAVLLGRSQSSEEVSNSWTIAQHRSPPLQAVTHVEFPTTWHPKPARRTWRTCLRQTDRSRRRPAAHSAACRTDAPATLAAPRSRPTTTLAHSVGFPSPCATV